MTVRSRWFPSVGNRPYVAIETWLNRAATNGTRGGLLAAYMVVVTAAQGVGQLLFRVADARGHAVFVLTAVLISAAVVPVTLMAVSPPEVPEVERLSFRALYGAAPLAVVTAAMAGFSGATILGGGGAVYASSIGLTRPQTSAMFSPPWSGRCSCRCRSDGGPTPPTGGAWSPPPGSSG